MPKAIDLIVKNGAATPIDKTFTLLAPAAGNGGVAEWALKDGAISSIFPRFTSAASVTTNRSRKVQLKLTIPSSYTDTVTGLTQVGSRFEVNVNCSVPNDFPEILKADAVAFFSNLMSHPMVKEQIRDALSAT